MENCKWLKIIIVIISPIFSLLGISVFVMPIMALRIIIAVGIFIIFGCCIRQYFIDKEKEENNKNLNSLAKRISELSEDEPDENEEKIQKQAIYGCIKEKNAKLSGLSKEIRGYIITTIIVMAIFYVPRSQPIITMAKEIARVVTAPLAESSVEKESEEEKLEEEKPEEKKPEEEKLEEEKPEEEKPEETWVKFYLEYPEGYPEISDNEMERLYDLLFYASEVDLDRLNEKILSTINIWINSSKPNVSLDNAKTESGRSTEYYTDIESEFSNENGKILSSKLLDEVISGREELFGSYSNGTLAWLLANHYQTYALNYDNQTNDANSILYFYMKSIEYAQKSLEFNMDIDNKNKRINYIKWRFKDINNCEALDINVRTRAGYIFDAIENALKALDMENLPLDETEEQ